SSGSLVFAGDGTLRYTPEPGFIGVVNIVYQAFDGLLYSDPIVVSIQVDLPLVSPGSGGGTDSGNGSGSGSGSGSSGSGGSGSGTQDNGSNTTSDESPSGQSSDTGSNGPASVDPGNGALTGSTDVGSAQSASQGGERGGEIKGGQEVAALEEMKLKQFGVDFREFTSRTSGSKHFGEYSRFGHMDEDVERANKRDDERLNSTWMTSRHAEEQIRKNTDSIDVVMLNMVVGTGLVLWVVQGAQFAATLITVAPAWLQIDPLAVMMNERDKKFHKEEISAGEKLFE
ncbi:MAG: Ig-like domain-containing protein, partial [Pirellula sp.]